MTGCLFDMNKNEAIVRHIKTNEVYRYLGNNVFLNLRTQVQGNVPDDVAQKIFNINMPLTIALSENPNIEKLIYSLQLKIE